MKTYLKRGINAETGRDMDNKSTKLNADEHYGVAIYDDTKLLVIKPFDFAAGTVLEQNVAAVEDTSVRKSNKGKAAAKSVVPGPTTSSLGK